MTTTTYLEWDDQATGANDNTWGDVLDANQTIFETAIARVLSIATTGGTTVLTSDENRYPIIIVTGTLLSNASIRVRSAEKNWIFINKTNGSYWLRVTTSGGTSKYLPRGRATKLYCDGTNVEAARDSVIPYAEAGGTANAITASFEPETDAYNIEKGYIWAVEAANANSSTTPTFTPDGLTTYTIEKAGGQALVAGDIRAGHCALFMFVGGGKVELLNPAMIYATAAEAVAMTEAAKVITPATLGALLTKGANVAGATTISLGDGGFFVITGTGWSCTDIDFATSSADGRAAVLYINNSGTLVHNATSLPLPGAADIALVAGDIVTIWQSNGNDIKVTVNRASGRAVVETWEYVETLTASTSANLTTSSLANYSTIRATLRNIRPATDDVEFRAQLSSDGATFLSTGYDGRSSVATTAATTEATAPADGAVTGTGANVGMGNQTSDGPLSGQIMFGTFNQARKTAIHSTVTYGNPSGNFRSATIRTLNDQSTAMTHIRFTCSSGAIEAGTIVIEGMR